MGGCSVSVVGALGIGAFLYRLILGMKGGKIVSKVVSVLSWFDVVGTGEELVEEAVDIESILRVYFLLGSISSPGASVWHNEDLIGFLGVVSLTGVFDEVRVRRLFEVFNPICFITAERDPGFGLRPISIYIVLCKYYVPFS